MASYTCPTCKATMARDMLLFYKHTDQHIVDVIREQNPAWVTDDGYCPKCLNFFKKEIAKARGLGLDKITNPSLVNMGIGGVRKRTMIGLVSLGLAVTGLLMFHTSGAPKVWRAALFFPFLIGMLGLIQAREQICVVFGAKGTKETEGKEEEVTDKVLAKALRQASRQILALSIGLALVFTTVAWIL